MAPTRFLSVLLLFALPLCGAAPAVAQAERAGLVASDTARALTSREIYLDFATYSSVGRGAVTRAIFSLSNYEDDVQRVTVRIEGAAGWQVMENAFLDRVHELDTADEIEGELYLVAPKDALVGSTHHLRLVAHIEGDPGVAEAVAPVRISAGGGLQPGQVGFTGSAQAYRHGIDLDARERGTLAGSLDLSSGIARGTTLSLSVQRGHRLNQAPVLSDYTSSQDRYAVDLRGRGWVLAAGNQVLATGSALTGPFVRTEGASFRKLAGVWVADVAAGRPQSFTGEAAGHVARATVGMQTSALRAAVAFSDLERPTVGYTRGHSIRGGGIEAELRPHPAHRLLVRGGLLTARNDTGAVSTGHPLEAQYALGASRVGGNLRARVMPASIPGAYLAGNEQAADAWLKLGWNLRASARGFRTETVNEGGIDWTSEGGSAGLQWLARGGQRVEVRGNYREATSSVRTIRRTLQLLGGTPLGPLTLDAMVERGDQLDMTRGIAAETQLARAGVRWLARTGSAYASVSYSDYGTGEPRLRADLTTTLRLAWLELDGGAWATRGPNYGGTPGVWANAALPITGGFSVIVGGEYVQGRRPYVRYVDPVTGEPLPPEIDDDPTQAPFVGVPVQVPASPFRVTLGVRKQLVLPLPFAGVRRHSAVTSAVRDAAAPASQ